MGLRMKGFLLYRRLWKVKWPAIDIVQKQEWKSFSRSWAAEESVAAHSSPHLSIQSTKSGRVGPYELKHVLFVSTRRPTERRRTTKSKDRTVIRFNVAKRLGNDRCHIQGLVRPRVLARPHWVKSKLASLCRRKLENQRQKQQYTSCTCRLETQMPQLHTPRHLTLSNATSKEANEQARQQEEKNVSLSRLLATWDLTTKCIWTWLGHERHGSNKRKQRRRRQWNIEAWWLRSRSKFQYRSL